MGATLSERRVHSEHDRPRAASQRRSQWRGVLTLAMPSLIALAVYQALLSRLYIDDSYIFYRYAANWGHGLGPVFNRGEHVEGFSSFLWTAILAACSALGAAPEDVAPVLGIALAAGCLVLVALVARGPLKLSPWLAAGTALLLALSPAFETYASSGMDVALFALVLLGAVFATGRYVESLREGELARRRAAWTAALLGALVLVRAEGPLYAVAIGVLAAALGATDARTGRRAPARLLPLAVAVGSTAMLLVFRRVVYGTWVPATVLAKGYTTHLAGAAIGSGGGLGNLWQALGWGVDYIGPPALVVLGLVAVALGTQRHHDRRLAPVPALGAVAIGLCIATALWSTGDWMPYRRLLVPVLSLMILLGAWGLTVIVRLAAGRLAPRASFSGPVRLAAAGGAVLGLVAGGLASGPVAPNYEARQLQGIGHLVAGLPRPARLLTNLAGVLPYYAGSRTYVWDMLGLTDIHNAEHGNIWSPQFGRTDPRYDFTRPFDLFVSNSSWDFALLNQTLSKGSGPWLLFDPPGWQRIPLYVVARSGGVLPDRLSRFCACRPIRLAARERRRLLASLLATGAVPLELLEAARRHRPFPA